MKEDLKSACDELRVTEIRKLMPVTGIRTYFDHASVAPISTPVRDAMALACSEHLHVDPRILDGWRERTEEIRASAARVIHGETDGLAFVQNTSSGLSLVANGLDWEEGDNVVLPRYEFPSNFYPWMNLSRRGVEVRLVEAPDGHASSKAIAEAMDARTRVVAVSAVQYSNGYRYDLQELGAMCALGRSLFVVDGTQAVGAVAVHVVRDKIDVLAVGAHKWVMGPMGTGFVHLSHRALDQIRPSVLGWLSVADPFAFNYELELAHGAKRFEPGTQNVVGLYGLGAALSLMEAVGVDQIEQRLLKLIDFLIDGLQSKGLQVHMPGGHATRSGIVVFSNEREALACTHARLGDAGVISALRGRGIRFSPHYYNTEDEIDRAVSLAANACE